MRIFVIPARYTSELEAAVKRTVEQIHLDIYRRSVHEKPLIPDFGIDERRTGDVFVAVGLVRDQLVAAVEAVRAGRDKAKKEKRAS
jgi:hypothetical protein